MHSLFFKLKYLCFMVLLSGFVKSQTVKQLHIVFRHGERAPTETYKNDPYRNMTWSGGWGQLTNRGKSQMYNLGLMLRDYYSDFIPEYYCPDDVKVVSSYADRCLMSAQALLAGLFPPRDKQIWNEDLLWQPIPTHYVPRSQDNLIAMKAKCKNYDEELDKILSSREIQKINEENSELYEYLSKHTGQKIETLLNVELLYNTLEIERLHELVLPDWTKNISFDHMKFLAARSLALFTETDFMKRMKGGVFLKQVISAMEKEKGPSLFLYSAHDISLVNILQTLGYTEGLEEVFKPGFGASFILELRNTSEIVMTYRNTVESDPQVFKFQGVSNFWFLDKFKEALEPFLPQNWEEECNN